jgi:hypothetical protein
MDNIKLKNNLVINFNIADENSWSLNDSVFTITSLNRWNKAISEDVTLLDYGLTAFDYGFTNKMWEKLDLKSDNTYLTLKSVGYNNVLNPTNSQTSGMTITTNILPFEMIGSGSTRYIQLNGGYLNNFYKLEDYNYELLPNRFKNGITIESTLFLNEDSFGIFYTMGVRSEDKYNSEFIGEEGLKSSEDNYLTSYIDESRTKINFRLPEENKEFVKTIKNQADNLKNNLYSFEITDDKRIGYRLINNFGRVEYRTSNKILDTTGFTTIHLVFTPYLIVDDDCNMSKKQQYGDLNIYVNHRFFEKFIDFPEFNFSKINNHKEKQIGVPYNISFGGGSFGLKNSWHYDKQTYNLYNSQTVEYLNNNFELLNASLNLSVNDDKFDFSVISLTGNNTGNNNTLTFNKTISVLPNRDYEVSVKLFDCGIFKTNTSKVKLDIISNDNIPIVTDDEYTGDYMMINGLEKWITVKKIFKTENISEQIFVTVKITLESDLDFNNKELFLNEFQYTAQDILVKDSTKDMLCIENNFDESFNGGIQKLKIYDIPLNSQDISYLSDNLINNKGGRLIYK